MSEERAGKFLTRIARGRLSSECTTGLPLPEIGMPAELLELLLLLLGPHVAFVPLEFKAEEDADVDNRVVLGTATADCNVLELLLLKRPAALEFPAVVVDSPIGLLACEWEEAVDDDEEEELCDEL